MWIKDGVIVHSIVQTNQKKSIERNNRQEIIINVPNFHLSPEKLIHMNRYFWRIDETKIIKNEINEKWLIKQSAYFMVNWNDEKKLTEIKGKK